MSTVVINGKRMNISGGNICISSNKVYVDGKLVTDDEANEPVRLIVDGDVLSVKSEGDVEINGNVQENVKSSGSVNCNYVGGNLNAGGSVHCGDISGNVECSGSVHCGNITGDVDAGGSVKCIGKKWE